MSQSTHDRHKVASPSLDLGRQIATMEALRDILKEEHRALQLRDPETLLSIAERKAACLEEAERAKQQLEELELPAAEKAATAGDPSINLQREELDTLTRLCQELNTVNGKLIGRQKTRIETSLRILRGEPESPDVYGPSGTRADQNRSRLLASI